MSIFLLTKKSIYLHRYPFYVYHNLFLNLGKIQLKNYWMAVGRDIVAYEALIREIISRTKQ